MPPLRVAFVGASSGTWAIERMETVAGGPLTPAARLTVAAGPGATAPPAEASWVLRGVTSNDRYTTAAERSRLTARQQPLGRAEATRAALIPIKKSAAWWELAQDERRRILAETSQHIATGLEYLPAVARRLHHGRDLGEPFDFLTWFDFAPEHAAAFDDLVRRLRDTREWSYVVREIDVRLRRPATAG
jgi:chlorite dismutase